MAESSGALRGYLLGRHGCLAEYLGPLVAADAATAYHLATAGIAQSHSRPCMIDVPRHTPEWVQWLEARGFREERPFLRMFRGANAFPGLPGQVYAIAGPELG